MSGPPEMDRNNAQKVFNGTSAQGEDQFSQDREETMTSFSKSALFQILNEKIPLLEKNASLMKTLNKKHAKLVEEMARASLNDVKMDRVRFFII